MSLRKLKKGDTVILKAFTGMKVGVFSIQKATERTITIFTKKGKKLIFDRATGVQINTEDGKERYACTIIENDGTYVRVPRKRKSKKEPVIPLDYESEEFEDIESIDDYYYYNDIF